MLILTKVSKTGARIYDTDDKTNEEISFKVLAEKLRKNEEKIRQNRSLRRLKIYGLSLYNPNAYYPNDVRVIANLGLAIIPSEANMAIAKYQKSLKK